MMLGKRQQIPSRQTGRVDKLPGPPLEIRKNHALPLRVVVIGITSDLRHEPVIDGVRHTAKQPIRLRVTIDKCHELAPRSFLIAPENFRLRQRRWRLPVNCPLPPYSARINPRWVGASINARISATSGSVA